MSPPSRRMTDKRFSGTLADRIRHARHLVGISRAALANEVGVVPSAVAQWEGSQRTSPTVEHLTRVAQATNVAFEWLATGRGPTTITEATTPAVYMQSFALDLFEERLLVAFRKLSPQKREAFVTWLEKFV